MVLTWIILVLFIIALSMILNVSFFRSRFLWRSQLFTFLFLSSLSIDVVTMFSLESELYARYSPNQRIK
ncbi:hypothetical protein Lade_1271 [Legionella adelaidensis]|uniref:Uncharacterized protein n=1 Tax=Legionella adelaidensis TaxID=45056 RepID=A0A0W0R6G6_9GAMM|nr:hypothetical protein Lade_1271 [Legionella adelaidensis]